mmetsp:Transcript_17732/g.15647  ORF Transcript_17732/g.15647 Transcript_17732/m.15647 type:complete len:155 (+) Transcript_17732:120-584(+)
MWATGRVTAGVAAEVVEEVIASAMTEAGDAPGLEMLTGGKASASGAGKRATSGGTAPRKEAGTDPESARAPQTGGEAGTVMTDVAGTEEGVTAMTADAGEAIPETEEDAEAGQANAETDRVSAETDRILLRRETGEKALLSNRKNTAETAHFFQ